MAALVRPNRSTMAAGVETELVKTLMIFSGLGLLLSLLSAIEGVEPGFQALF